MRLRKQLIIGFIFVLILSGIGYGFVDYFFVVEPTCFDNIQSGQEEGVDCGFLACGVACEPAILPLNVQFKKLIEVRSEDYDFVAQVNNPNSIFGASLAKYDLNLFRNDGSSLRKTGTFYVLPGQTRYIIISGIRDSGALADAFLDITEVKWEKVQSFENLSFPVQRKSYAVLNKNGTFSELEAVIFNNSDFNFDKIEVGVILFSQSRADQPPAGAESSGKDNTLNNIVAVNRTDIKTFLSRTERYFKVTWPVELPTTVRQDIEILTNVFENSNFIKRYGTQERFQKYY